MNSDLSEWSKSQSPLAHTLYILDLHRIMLESAKAESDVGPGNRPLLEQRRSTRPGVRHRQVLRPRCACPSRESTLGIEDRLGRTRLQDDGNVSQKR